MQNKFESWWVIAALGGALLLFSGDGGDSSASWLKWLSYVGVEVVDPDVKQLAEDSEKWAREVGSPKECAAVAACFEQIATKKGQARAMIEDLREAMTKALPPESHLQWSTFRDSVTMRLRTLNNSGKVGTSAESHSPYMQAIAQGVRRAG